MPQKAAVVGLDIFLKDYWRVDLNVNAFADTYLDPNPDRRTSEGVDLVDPVNNAELYRTIVGQEKLPGGVTLDVGIFKSWRLKTVILSDLMPIYPMYSIIKISELEVLNN